MDGDILKAQQRAQFDSSMVLIRHVVENCVDEDLALRMYRQIVKEGETLRKRFNLAQREK